MLISFTCSPNLLSAQDKGRTYKLDDGTLLTKSQVDSLSEVYNDQLKFKYIRDDGETTVIVIIPEGKLYKKSSSFTVTENETKSSSEDLQSEYIFKDTLNNEITRSAFQKLMEELGEHPVYSINLKDKKRIITMSPPSSPEAKLMMKELSEKRAKLL